ncbi:hypothetical protein KAJ27_16230 [bacterium]|nr:hypothetical protein [bacterium]
MDKKKLLIKCPECKHKFKSDVKICSICGFDIGANVDKLREQASKKYSKRFGTSKIVKYIKRFFKK